VAPIFFLDFSRFTHPLLSVQPNSAYHNIVSFFFQQKLKKKKKTRKEKKKTLVLKPFKKKKNPLNNDHCLLWPNCIFFKAKASLSGMYPFTFIICNFLLLFLFFVLFLVRVWHRRTNIVSLTPFEFVSPSNFRLYVRIMTYELSFRWKNIWVPAALTWLTVIPL